MKQSGEQIDDRIVEVHWDPQLERWRMMRFRDDKPHGNFRTVVDNIIQSIADGVEKPMVSPFLVYPPLLTCWCQLLARGPVIRSTWKARLGQSQQSTVAQPLSGQVAPNGHVAEHPPPTVQFRYGPIAVSRWSKVSGPAAFAGMKR